MLGTPKHEFKRGPARGGLVWLGLFFMVGLALPRLAGAAPTVGMEGRVEVTLPGTLLEAKPVEPRTPLLVRIADTRPHGTLIAYDLRYVGLEPGKYDLREYLVRHDGSGMDDVPSIPAEVASLLPRDHDGLLVSTRLGPLPRFGGYKGFMLALVGVWGALLLSIVLSGRKPKSGAVEAAKEAPLTLADRLRPLVEEAAAGRLEPEGQARLERLLLAHWRGRLSLEELGMTEAIARLKAHPEAGELLCTLEDWLHRPPGQVKVDVNRVLEPYRHAAVPKEPEPRTA